MGGGLLRHGKTKMISVEHYESLNSTLFKEFPLALKLFKVIMFHGEHIFPFSKASRWLGGPLSLAFNEYQVVFVKGVKLTTNPHFVPEFSVRIYTSNTLRLQ